MCTDGAGINEDLSYVTIEFWNDDLEVKALYEYAQVIMISIIRNHAFFGSDARK